MKIIKITAFALATIALAACSNDEVVNTTQTNPNEISYDVVTNGSTRAASLYSNGSTLSSGFNVCASVSSSDHTTYFDGDVVNCDNSTTDKYVAAQKRYWPDATKALDFVAYCGTNNGSGTAAEKSFNTSTDGMLKFTGVTMPASADDQNDMLYAVSKNITRNGADGTSTANAGYVKLNFRHALARLNFKVQNNSNTITVKVDEVRVCNIKTKGNVTYGAASTLEQYTDAADQTYNYTTCEWPTNNLTTYTVTEGSDTKTINYSDVSSGTKVTAGSSAADIAKSTDADDISRYMFVIPQTASATGTLTANTAPTNPYFLVKCTIQNKSGSTDSDNDVYLYGTGDATKWALVKITDALTWQAGRSYTYTFVFSDGNNGGVPYDPENPDTIDPTNPVLAEIKYKQEITSIDAYATQTDTSLNATY